MEEPQLRKIKLNREYDRLEFTFQITKSALKDMLYELEHNPVKKICEKAREVK